MNRKQFEAKKAIIDKHRGLIDALMADIEKEFAEAEKPKLRDGDYFVDKDGVLPNIFLDGERYWLEGSGKVRVRESRFDDDIKMGNLKDDLAQLQEDVEKFTTDVHLYSIDSKQYPAVPIYMAGNHHSVAEVEEHILNLRKMLATYKRRQKHD